MQNMIFGVFFQSALICPILTHFEKRISKCVTWSQISNLTHFEKKNSKCVVTRLQNLSLRSALMSDEIGGIFIV